MDTEIKMETEEEKKIQQRIRRGSLALSKGSSRKILGKPKGSSENAWAEHQTPEGATYYFNSVTGKTTWDTPMDYALQETKESSGTEAESDEEWFWIKDDVSCFAAARKCGSNFKTIDGRSVRVESDGVVSKILRVGALNKDVDDMVKMEVINEATVLQNLRVRAERDEYFTNVGSILVSVNPFKWLDQLYTPDKFLKYRTRSVGDDVPPHFFEISDDAYRGLRDDGISQCIIISGESGAGKTEATKKCLQYIADIAGSGIGLENKLLASNPILEAFGNAKTSRNGNSSRFGKWTAVQFNHEGKICGGRIVNYLLEKSRVAIQIEGERNYHIFYQLIKGADATQRDMYQLPKGGCSSMSYLSKNGGCIDVKGINDEECFHETLQAFEELGFTADEQDDVLKILSGILWMGNIIFETPAGGTSDDACTVNDSKSEAAIQSVCEMLSVDKDEFLGHVMNRIRVMGGQTIRSPLNKIAADDSCAALAKEIYGRLFDWLVFKVNKTLSSGAGHSQDIIGVLDIFGFEIFENNSFEQLCINFTNEKLQQHFNNHTFKTEQKIYEQEGITFTPPVFEDNKDVLELLEERPRGLFVLLDEECVLPRGKDESFANKIKQFHNKQHKRFSVCPKSKSNLAFAVHHYAGLVTYNAERFLEKNKDDLRDNLLELARTSQNTLMCDVLFPLNRSASQSEGPASPRGGSQQRRHKTQSGFFRQQLQDLMTELNSSSPHYIRCIKPNSQKSADRFDPFLCLEQLRYSGIFEAIEIRKQGFPFRRSHEKFYKRYRCITDKGFTKSNDYLMLSTGLIDKLDTLVTEWKERGKQDLANLKQCRLGRTMVLYRAPEHLTMEWMLERKQKKAAKVITRVARGAIARSQVKVFKSLRQKLYDEMESRDIERIKSTLAEVKGQVRPPFSLYSIEKEAKELVKMIEQERELCIAIQELQQVLDNGDSTTAAKFYEEIETVLEKCEESSIATKYPEYAPVLESFDKQIADVRDLINAKRAINTALETATKPALVQAIQRATELTKTNGAFCEREISKAKEMLEKVIEQEGLTKGMLKELRTGMATGKIGELDLSSIETSQLRESWTKAKQEHKPPKNPLNPRTLGIMNVVELIIALRESVQDSKWDEMEGVLAKLETHESKGSFDTFEIPVSEIGLCREELNCFTIVSELTESLQEGQVSGQPGDLDIKSVSVEHLRADIDDAKCLNSNATVAQWAIQSAERILETRTFVLQGDWDAVHTVFKSGKLPEETTKIGAYGNKLAKAIAPEIALIRDELYSKLILERAKLALAKGSVTGVVGELNTTKTSVVELESLVHWLDQDDGLKGKCPTEQTHECMQVVKLVINVRKLACGSTNELSKLKPELHKVSIKNQQYIPQECVDELKLINSEIAEQESIEVIERSFTKGQVSGKIGKLNFETISIESLLDAKEQAGNIWTESGMEHGAESKHGTKLFDALQELIKLRTSVKAQNWDIVEDILENSHALFVKPTEEEVLLIQEELNNRMIIAELTEALSNGSVSGPVGEPELDKIRIDTLQEDIADAKELGCKTREAKELLECALLVLGLREALLKSDWKHLEKLVDQIRFTRVVKPAQEECKRVEKELNNRRIIHEIERALDSGGPRGTLDNLRLDTIAFHQIDEALALGQKLRCESKKAKHLFAATKVVQAGRNAMSQGRFLQLGPLIEDAERQGFLRIEGHDDGFDQEKYSAVTAAHSELNLMRDKFQDENMKHELAAALTEGKASGRVGLIEISSVKLKTLLKLVSKYSLVETKTESAKQLLTSAELIVQLREGLMAGPDWEEVEKVTDVMKSDVMIDKYGFNIVNQVAAEVEFIRDEITHRKIMSSLTAALESGTVCGSISSLDLSDVSVDELNVSIELVKTMECKTPESTRLFNTALAVRDMRLCVLKDSKKDTNWAGVVQVTLDRAHSVGVSDIAKEELKLVQNHVDDIKISSELCTALAQGSIQGELGGAIHTSCDVERLNSALNCARTLVCKTERSKKLEKTAKVILDLRNSVAKGDWPSFEKELEKQLGVSIWGGTAPDSFHNFSEEASAEFQRLIDECRERKAQEELTGGLRQGALEGYPGKLLRSSLDVTKLTQAFNYVERIKDAVTQNTKDGALAAECVIICREALKNGGDDEEGSVFDVVGSALARLPSFDRVGMFIVPEDTKNELQLIQDHRNEYLIVQLAKESIKDGSGGAPIKVSLLETSSLTNGLRTIDGSLGGPKSEKCTDIVNACHIILDMRTALQRRDFLELQNVLDRALECTGISLLAEAESQVYAARSLLVNHETVTSLVKAFETGSILENHTNVDLVCAKALEDALTSARNQVAGELDLSVTWLLECYKLVIEMRKAFAAVALDNWNPVETVLAKVDNFEKLHETKFSGEDNDFWTGEQVELVKSQQENICREFQLVRELFEDRKVYHMVLEAMSEGHLGGSVGNVTSTMLKVAPLEQAVEAANVAVRLSERTSHALEHARNLLTMRRAVLADDWGTVHQFARNWSLAFNSNNDNTTKCYAMELELMWEESNRRIVVDQLTHALVHGAVEGEPGDLRTHRVSAAPLNKAIAKALEIGTKTGDTQQLLLAAHTVRQIRNGILAQPQHGGGGGRVDCPLVRDALRVCREEGVSSLPEIVQKEIHLVMNELEDQESAKKLTEALREPTSHWEESETPVDEYSLAVSNTPYEEEMGVERLNGVIASVQEVNCHTIFTKALLKLANLMRDVRLSIRENSWTKAMASIKKIEEISSRVHEGDAPISTQQDSNQQWRAALILVQNEVETAKDLIENHRLVQMLRDAVGTGRAPGTFGYLRTDKASVDKLNKCIHFAGTVGCKTEETTVLLKTARFLRQVRMAMAEEDYITASVIIGEVHAFAISLGGMVGTSKSKSLHRLPGAGLEFEILYHEIENKLVCLALKEALEVGRVTGKVGAVAILDLNIQSLERATSRAASLEEVADETAVLIHSSKAILKLRQLLYDCAETNSSSKPVVRMWDTAKNIVSSAVANAPDSLHAGALLQNKSTVDTTKERRLELSNPKVENEPMAFNLMWCHAYARDELILLLDEIQHREALALLTHALSSGHAKFLGGFVDVSTVKTGALQNALSNAKLVPTRTEELTTLQLSAAIILRAREALMDGSWQDLATIMNDAKQVCIHQTALDEINMLHREVQLHSIIKAVLLKIQKGSSERNIDALEAALHEADSLRLSSSPDLHVLARVNKARQLLDRLNAVDEKVKLCVNRSDLTGLDASLEEAKNLQFTPRSVPRVDDLRDRIKQFFNKAEIAVETVDTSAIRQLLEMAQNENIQLPREEEMRRLLAYPPTQLEKMRLNAAIQRGDEEAVIASTMGMKTKFFEQESTRELHRLEYFKPLKTPQEFAANTGVIASGLQATMLSHSTTPIPSSLTRMDSTPAGSLAVKIFRALLGYMGDRQYSYPVTLAHEILQVGLAVPELRDEIFLQMMKQLTDNPVQSSRDRGWLLMRLAFETFPPSESFENFIELWLRRKSVELRSRNGLGVAFSSKATNYATDCLHEMHRVVFKGPALRLPALDDIYEMLGIMPSHSS